MIRLATIQVQLRTDDDRPFPDDMTLAERIAELLPNQRTGHPDDGDAVYIDDVLDVEFPGD